MAGRRKIQGVLYDPTTNYKFVACTLNNLKERQEFHFIERNNNKMGGGTTRLSGCDANLQMLSVVGARYMDTTMAITFVSIRMSSTSRTTQKNTNMHRLSDEFG